MVTTTKTFNFDGIFPTCMNEYSTAIEGAFREREKYNNVCTKIGKKLGNSDGYFNFICVDLSFFLEHIKKKRIDEKEKYCKYFFYKLKDDLKEESYNCINENNCYKEIINTEVEDNNNLFNICKDNDNGFDENIFEIFDYLNKLYTELKLFSISINRCHFDDKYFNEYMRLLKDFHNNDSLSRVLTEADEQYKIYLKKLLECSDAGKLIHYFSRIFGSFFVLTFFITIIILVLCKYTSYSLYTQQIFSMLRNLWNNRRKEQHKLYNLFYIEYKNLIENNY
ncbi:variable surface protein [Plasmodium gonderi]|uniref:Variable surface protein n=1 Tax=Plasmodium gonderi TaxID=77519 RepID=A0A1Y1JUQ5_PLAGO|nr:variable surface protein [Plasmodium gonderi]GAW84482.1 variable surface protein [Plasmodium gonderi]